MTDIARYSPSKIRARAEEKLGWAPGSSKDISFNTLREVVAGLGQSANWLVFNWG